MVEPAPDRLTQVEDFGAIDAESDELLLASFEAHQAYGRLVDGREFLMLGRKGSGKTAIYKKLMSIREHDVFTVGHTFTDYPWHYHDRQVIPEAADQERYLHSWRYLILISLAKIVLNYDNSLPVSDAGMDHMLKIEQFIIDTYGARDPDVTEVFHPGKRLRSLRGLNVDLKVLKLDVGRAELEMQHLPVVFQDVNRNLQGMLLETLNPAHRYYICFDQLDIGFDPGSEPYKLRLIGLILAARDFNIAARDAGKTVKVVVFLRSDIYGQSLQFEDKNKVTDTYSVQLEWDRNGTSTLKSLMERRFSEVLNTDTHWSDVFDETTEMRGHQDKYSHIRDRTFSRPRDFIKFCNAVLDEYKQRMAKGIGEAGKFSTLDVNSARPKYSAYLRDELDDELYTHLPDVDTYLEMLKQVGVAVFTLGDFEQGWEDWRERLKDSASAVEILERLFRFSIVGFYRPGGGGYGGSEYVFSYLEPRSDFNRTAERFRVHRGLVEVLNLKQYARKESQFEE